MTDDDRLAFTEALFVLSETFNEPLSTTRAEGYFAALKEFPIEHIEHAVRQALRTSKFFPRPVELAEHIAGRGEDQAVVAWAAVLREIRRVGYVGTPTLDPRTLGTVEALWGSWRHLCETLPSEGPELVGWVKQFKITYETLERRETYPTLESVHPTVLAFIRGLHTGEASDA